MRGAALCVAVALVGVVLRGWRVVSADLEVYPDYAKSDEQDPSSIDGDGWAKDYDTFNYGDHDLQLYLEGIQRTLPRYEEHDRAGMPYLHALHIPPMRSAESGALRPPLDFRLSSKAVENYFKKPLLARRIAELSRKLHEIHEGHGRRPPHQYFFKTYSRPQQTYPQQLPNGVFSMGQAPEESPYDEVPEPGRNDDDFTLNYRIMDDVRGNQEDYNENGNEGYENEEEEEEVINNENYDPSEFAYMPTDPRYFRDLPGGSFDRETSVSSSAVATTTTSSRTTTAGVKKSQKDSETSHSILSFGGFNSRSNNFRNQQLLPAISNIKYAKTDGLEIVPVKPHHDDPTGVYIIAIVAGISAAATVGLIAFGIGWYNLQKHVKSASDVDYPAYGVTGPNKEISPSGDRRLAQSAQMYHYQHQKQQIIAMERAAAGERHGSVSEADSDDENEEGDYTVYECPGLAPTGEMEVKNPLFQDDPTPAQTPAQKSNSDGSNNGEKRK